MKNVQTYIGLACCLILCCSSLHAQDEHPRVIVRASDYEELRAKSQVEPWATIYSSAQSKWNDSNPGTSSGAAALCYILDQDDQSPTRRDYIDAILGSIDRFHRNNLPQIDYKKHGKYVYNATNYMNLVIALDVIHDDLNQKELRKAESQLNDVTKYYRDHARGWRLVQHGVLSTWATYQGNPSAIRKTFKGYFDYLDPQTGADGSWREGAGYLGARIAGTRTAKSWPLDIATYNEYADVYNDERYQNLAASVTHFMLTPFGSYQVFGDTGHRPSSKITHLHMLARLGHYDEKLGQNGAWYIKNNGSSSIITGGANSLFDYATLPDHFPELLENASIPQSILMDNFGASLWDRDDSSSEALMATLHSFSQLSPRDVKRGRGHNHENSGSLFIAGYGEYLLTNAGVHYHGGYPGRTPAGERWFFANMQNSVTIGDKTRHASFYGNGLDAGVVGGPVEFARVDAGPALGNGKHERTLFMVHGQDRISNGYFVLLDDVAPDNPSDVVKINFRPNTTSPLAADNPRQYTAKINGFVEDNNDGSERLSLYFATTPQDFHHYETFIGSHFGSKASHAVEAHHKAGANGKLRAMTVLFPSDAKHIRPEIEDRSTEDANVTVIHHSSDLTDTLLASPQGRKISNDGIGTFQGSALVVRQNKNALVWFAATRSQAFRSANGELGFEANRAIDLVVNNTSVSIDLAMPTQVVFYKHHITGVSINGKLQQTTAADGGIKVNLPAGRFQLELLLAK